MPADTFSSILGILLMGTGNDNNTWGSNANSAVFTVLEQAIAGQYSNQTLTGGTLDLSTNPPPAAAAQTAFGILNFGGVLASTQIVKVPNLTNKWVVYNNTTGNQLLQMKTPSGAATTIPSGMNVVFCDGLNHIFVLSQPSPPTFVTQNDVTVSRTFTTPYTNNGTTPMAVSIIVSTTGAFQCNFVINGIAVFDSLSPASGTVMSFFGIVPAGATYQLNNFGASGTFIARWVETQ